MLTILLPFNDTIKASMTELRCISMHLNGRNSRSLLLKCLSGAQLLQASVQWLRTNADRSDDDVEHSEQDVFEDAEFGIEESATQRDGFNALRSRNFPSFIAFTMLYTDHVCSLMPEF